MVGKNRKISGFILLLLFAFNYVGNNFFLHTHILDGEKVVHSHPYSSDSHIHSRVAFQLISQTSFTLAAIVIAPLMILIFKELIGSFVKFFFKELSVIFSSPRAPPALNY